MLRLRRLCANGLVSSAGRKRCCCQPIHEIKPKLQMIEFANAFVAEEHGIGNNRNSARAKTGAPNQARARRTGPSRCFPSDRSFAFCDAPARAEEAGTLDSVRQRRALKWFAEEPLRIVVDTGGVIKGRSVFDSQAGRREQFVEIVAI